MLTTKRNLYIFFALALLPCIAWGMVTLACIMLKDNLNYSKYLSDHHVYRILYLLRTLTFLPMLLAVYKRFLPSLYYAHKKIYIQCAILSVICILCGLLVKTKFWNYILDGCLVSPLIEELIARFILYEARNQGFKLYALAAIITSLSFGLMHFGYEPSAITQAIILPKLSGHTIFGLILCGIFWFLPRLSLLIIVHSLFNLFGILAMASELQ